VFTEKDAKKALIELAAIKGKERAQLIERILRWETGHFKSQQYKLTGSAGMEAGDWKNLDESKMKTIKMADNHPEKVKEKMRTFLVWDNVLSFCLYLSDYIDRYNGNYARWNSTSEVQQSRYRKSINSVKTRFIK